MRVTIDIDSKARSQLGARAHSSQSMCRCSIAGFSLFHFRPCCLSDPWLDPVVGHPCRLVSAWYHKIAIKWRWTREPVQWSRLVRGRAFSPRLLADKKPLYPHPPSPKLTTPTFRWVAHTYFTGLVPSHCPCLLPLMVIVGSYVNGPGRAAVGVAVKPPDEGFRRFETTPYRSSTCPCAYCPETKFMQPQS